MRKSILSLVVGLVLFATVVLPPVVYLALGASSQAAGVLAVSGLYILVFVAVAALSPLLSMGTGVHFVAVVVGVVSIQGVLSLSINNEFDIGRFWQASVLLAIFLLGALSFARLAHQIGKPQADFALKFVFYALLLIGFAGISGYSPFSRENVWKPVLVFAEPSHFAVSFLPFIYSVVVISRPRLKAIVLFASFLMAILLESLTLVVGVALVVVLVVPLSRLLFVMPLATILLGAIDPEVVSTVVDIDYYTVRTDLSRENQNLSTMAFMQGWERAYLNFGDSYGLGIGFQQFGIVGSRGEIFEELTKLSGEELNLLDGGSVASKLIGEFGILGVMTLLAYLIYFVKSARWLQEVSLNRTAPRDCKQVFFLACFAMYCVDLFVRGAGYFSSTGFLFIVSVLWMALSKPSVFNSKPMKLAESAKQDFCADTVGLGSAG